MNFEEKQALQTTPEREAMSTESLESLSPAELANALEAALDTMTEEDYDPAVIDAYLAALERKAPMPQGPDAEEALSALREKFQSAVLEDARPAREVAPARTVRRRSFRRVLGTVAATVALLLALMVGAQAAGIDVFGNLARWTDELFFFSPLSNEDTGDLEGAAIFQQALGQKELPKDLAPTWYPEGFTAGEPEFWDDAISRAVELAFTNSEGKSFVVSVDYYPEVEAIGEIPIEKDAGGVEQYTSNGRTFYIMSNVNSVTAAWADGHILEMIRGGLSVDEVKTMIDSMGG